MSDDFNDRLVEVCNKRDRVSYLLETEFSPSSVIRMIMEEYLVISKILMEDSIALVAESDDDYERLLGDHDELESNIDELESKIKELKTEAALLGVHVNKSELGSCLKTIEKETTYMRNLFAREVHPVDYVRMRVDKYLDTVSNVLIKVLN